MSQQSSAHGPIVETGGHARARRLTATARTMLTARPRASPNISSCSCCCACSPAPRSSRIRHGGAAHFSPQVSWAFMMAVSCTKAMLVILFFMHVMYEANWKFVLTIPAALMSIFLILMLVPDVGMRGRWASEERKFHQAEERAVEREHGQQLAGRASKGPGTARRPTEYVATMSSSSAISVNGVSHWYGQRQALDGSFVRSSLGRDLRVAGPQRRRQIDAVSPALHAVAAPARLGAKCWDSICGGRWRKFAPASASCFSRPASIAS